MKVLVLLPSLKNTSPGSRFRIEQWAPYLEPFGFQFTFASFEDPALHQIIYQPKRFLKKGWLFSRAMIRRAGILPLLRQHDLVFIYEEATKIGPPIIEWLIHSCRTPIVYDFCDPIYLPYVSPINRHLSYLKFFGKYRHICRLASQIMVGNEYLAEFARRHNPNVHVVPITIDTAQYTVARNGRTPPDRVIVGWSGSATTVSHLETLRDGLRRVARQSRFELRVIGTARPSLDGVPFSYTPWRQDSEVADLQQLDIGIMPLPADQWTRLRTHLKIRQYMGVGVPAVASPVGVIPEVIQDAVNGYLPRTEDEWVERLTLLIENRALRSTLGQAGRATIEEKYSTQVWAPRICTILEAAASSRRRN